MATAVRIAQDIPSNMPMVDADRTVSMSWLSWLQWVQSAVASIRSSGTTLLRPTSGVWVGRFYMDTTLGKPVYVLSVSPIVWVDAAGTVV